MVVSGGTALQTTGTTSYTSQWTMVDAAVLLILALILCAVIIAVGATTKKTWLLSSGVVAAGIMTIVTPLVVYVAAVLSPGGFVAQVQDFLLLATLSALGGGIITIGAVRFMQRKALH
jgi:hypothetical protein